METKVLTTEEIQQLNEINDKRIQLIEQFGILEIKIQDLLLQKDIYKEELNILRQIEIQVGQSLQTKYGDGSINLSKGEFISS